MEHSSVWLEECLLLVAEDQRCGDGRFGRSFAPARRIPAIVCSRTKPRDVAGSSSECHNGAVGSTKKKRGANLCAWLRFIATSRVTSHRHSTSRTRRPSPENMEDVSQWVSKQHLRSGERMDMQTV